jgi:hypothetical protein
MTEDLRQELAREAGRNLRAYLKSGLSGFKQKAVDRMRALDLEASLEDPVEVLLSRLQSL